MTEPGRISNGFYGLPWSLLIINAILCASFLVMLFARRMWPQRWQRLQKRLGGILNRSLDAKRKDKNWGKYMP